MSGIGNRTPSADEEKKNLASIFQSVMSGIRAHADAVGGKKDAGDEAQSVASKTDDDTSFSDAQNKQENVPPNKPSMSNLASCQAPAGDAFSFNSDEATAFRSRAGTCFTSEGESAFRSEWDDSTTMYAQRSEMANQGPVRGGCAPILDHVLYGLDEAEKQWMGVEEEYSRTRTYDDDTTAFYTERTGRSVGTSQGSRDTASREQIYCGVEETASGSGKFFVA